MLKLRATLEEKFKDGAWVQLGITEVMLQALISAIPKEKKDIRYFRKNLGASIHRNESFAAVTEKVIMDIALQKTPEASWHHQTGKLVKKVMLTGEVQEDELKPADVARHRGLADVDQRSVSLQGNLLITSPGTPSASVPPLPHGALREPVSQLSQKVNERLPAPGSREYTDDDDTDYVDDDDDDDDDKSGDVNDGVSTNEKEDHDEQSSERKTPPTKKNQNDDVSIIDKNGVIIIDDSDDDDHDEQQPSQRKTPSTKKNKKEDKKKRNLGHHGDDLRTSENKKHRKKIQRCLIISSRPTPRDQNPSPSRCPTETKPQPKRPRSNYDGDPYVHPPQPQHHAPAPKRRPHIDTPF